MISHYNLNLNQALRQPIGASETKTLCCGPCKSDPITATLNVPKSKNEILKKTEIANLKNY